MVLFFFPDLTKSVKECVSKCYLPVNEGALITCLADYRMLWTVRKERGILSSCNQNLMLKS